MESLQDSVTYDGWERVTAWVQRQLSGSWVARDTFRFDRLGNIQTTAGAETYDPTTGRLLSRTDTVGTWSYTYDRAGNLVQAVRGSATWVYRYDALNRLRSVWRNGVFVAQYAYDVIGRRIAKRARTKLGGGALDYTRFVYRGANVGFETDSAGTIGLRYVWGPGTDDLIAIRDAVGNQVYVVQDKLRSVRGLVRRDGTWLMSQRFGPYGALLTQEVDATGIGFTLRYGWTGREFDVETGFYYHRSRYYDPGVRRFVQEDKIAYAGGANLYAYAEGRPLEGRDPAGHRANFEANPDWFNLDAFSGCFNFQCAETEYFFGLAGGGGARIGSYADLLRCIGNATCSLSVPSEAADFVLQQLILVENLAWLHANMSPGAGETSVLRMHFTIVGGFVGENGTWITPIPLSGWAMMKVTGDQDADVKIVHLEGWLELGKDNGTWARYNGYFVAREFGSEDPFFAGYVKGTAALDNIGKFLPVPGAPFPWPF